jgi:hypothetical protein
MADPLSQVPHPDCDSELPGDGSDADPEGMSPEAPIASSSARKASSSVLPSNLVPESIARWEGIFCPHSLRRAVGSDASSSAPNKACGGGCSSAPNKASGGSSSAPDASSSAPGSVFSAPDAVFPSWVVPGAPCQALYAYKSDDGHQHFYPAVVMATKDHLVRVKWAETTDYNLEGQQIAKWDKTEWVDTVRHPNSASFDSGTRGESNSIEARTLAASALSSNLLVTREEKRKLALKQYHERCPKRAAAESSARMGA